MSPVPDYTDYQKLCSLLEDVHSDEFLSASCDFRCQIIDPDTFHNPPSPEQWDRFIEVNRGKHLRDDALWEEWKVFPDRMVCARFFGSDDKGVYWKFVDIARASYTILLKIRELSEKQGLVPRGCEVELPTPNRSGRWCPLPNEFGWLTVLFDTGKFFRTAFLDVDTDLWGSPITPALIEERAADTGSDAADVAYAGLLEDFLHTPIDLGNSLLFPCCPLVYSLQYDLFTSSVEAIKVWFDDHDLVWIDELFSKPPIFLPSIVEADEPEVLDEPVVPEILKPTWDADRRELRLGDKVIKRFKLLAENQDKILNAFQEEDWPPRIDDPLPPATNKNGHPIEPKRRLRDTVAALKGHHQHENLILFEADGTGQGVLWTLLRRR